MAAPTQLGSLRRPYGVPGLVTDSESWRSGMHTAGASGSTPGRPGLEPTGIVALTVSVAGAIT
jgi:hypothetical protein